MVSHFATDGFALLRADAINRKPSSIDAALRSATNLRGGAADAEAATDPETAAADVAAAEEETPNARSKGNKPGKRGKRKGKGKRSRGGNGEEPAAENND